jgi:hypothetical protein
MAMKNSVKINNDELRDKIRKGLDLAFRKLVKQKQKENGILVFSKHGKIIKVNAKDLKD